MFFFPLNGSDYSTEIVCPVLSAKKYLQMSNQVKEMSRALSKGA